MRNAIHLLLLVLALPMFAQDDKALYRKLADAECLTQQDCEALIFDMARWSNSVLAIDGVEYLTSYNPLALISDKYEYAGIYEGLLDSWELMLTFLWGDAPCSSSAYSCIWELSNNRLFLTDIRGYAKGKKCTKESEMCGLPLYDRMEKFTGCKFVDGRMHLNTLSGVLYVKPVNTAPRPEDIRLGDDEKDFPAYVEWMRKPVYRLIFEKGVLVSKEELKCCDDFDSGENTPIYQYYSSSLDAKPKFPGGKDALLAYYRQHVNYPDSCREQGLEGTVVVSFIVNTDGTIAEPYVLKPANPHFDAEALRIVKSMPKWVPAVKDDRAVRAYVLQPFGFRLNNL